MNARVLALAFLLIGANGAAAASPTLRPLCPDRPGKATDACTVDQGHFQLEIDAYDVTLQRHAGVTTNTTFAANPTLKYGVTSNFDVELNLVPYIKIRSHSSGTTQADSGLGDLYLRAKYVPISGGPHGLSFGLEPFLKIPTAAHALGNGTVEGGLLLPVGLDLGGGWSLSSTPEFDALQNQATLGRHLAMINVVALSRAFSSGITVSGEVWNSSDFDRGGTVEQYSFDVAAAWQPARDPDLQLDAGVNVGLNGNTPDLQAYVGLSRRF